MKLQERNSIISESTHAICSLVNSGDNGKEIISVNLQGQLDQFGFDVTLQRLAMTPIVTDKINMIE
jgi:hypothetical protein